MSWNLLLPSMHPTPYVWHRMCQCLAPKSQDSEDWEQGRNNQLSHPGSKLTTFCTAPLRQTVFQNHKVRFAHRAVSISQQGSLENSQNWHHHRRTWHSQQSPLAILYRKDIFLCIAYIVSIKNIHWKSGAITSKSFAEVFESSWVNNSTPVLLEAIYF